MPRRFGLPSLYLAAAVVTAAATAVTTAVPLMTPASGLAARPLRAEPARPYIVTARDRAAARDLVGEVRRRVRRYYTAALPGFATMLNAAEEAELRADPRVLALEPDREIRPAAGRAALPARAPAGRGVTVYVVDSGVDVARLGDRAWRAFDATGGTGHDCTGHGTRVARAVAAAAPHARIASVRTLGCGGTGTLSDVLAGLDWVRRHARGPAVTSVQLDTAGSPALATAMRALVRSGVLVTAAGPGACRAAPGEPAYTAAAPRLAGAAARYLEFHPGANPADLTTWLKCTATRPAIRQNPSRTSNLLLRTGGL
ncbi:protease inhibitor I9 family protein [Nonomuraea sp. SBT364]|uniref:protease inhibitor I9 family protein n=1 Tax=Nonomuraea sp. SBT364 TaxID=1580530 RepID=UPI00066DD63A|nr:protease inhibitor I9 family protein [Nonomuraea sp. SBT364]